MTTRNLLSAFLISGALILLGSCANKNADETAFETVPVQRKSISSTIMATGIIKPKVGAEVRVGSRVSGIVEKLYVKNGDEVKKGQLLARIDDAELSAQYRLERANLLNVQTAAKYAKVEMDRMKALAAKDFSSAQTLDNAVKEYEIAVARVESSKASVDYASTQLGFTKIFAPISGVIGSVSTQEGETVSAAFAAPTFVTIIDLHRIEVWTYVDETDIGKVETGQKATFTVDTYTGERFEGIVSAIYPKAEIRDNVVNYIAIVEITNTKGKILRPEMTASVSIQTTESGKVLSVPNNVIKRRNAESVVYVLDKGKPVMQRIKTGVKGAQLTEVIEGLKENDRIIINSKSQINQ